MEAASISCRTVQAAERQQSGAMLNGHAQMMLLHTRFLLSCIVFSAFMIGHGRVVQVSKVSVLPNVQVPLPPLALHIRFSSWVSDLLL